MSGRMIPGMAMLTSAANPALRGTFMTLNSAVQSAAMGLAALVGGYIISRDLGWLGRKTMAWAAVVGGVRQRADDCGGCRLKLHQMAAPAGPSKESLHVALHYKNRLQSPSNGRIVVHQDDRK